MKNNNRNVEKVKKGFLLELKAYLKELESVNILQSQEPDFSRKSFGWSLYLSSYDSQYYLSLVEPRHKLDIDHKRYICLTESQGLLKITIAADALSQTYERECHQRLSESRQVRFYFKSISDCIRNRNEWSELRIAGLVYLICSLFAELIFDAPHLDQYMRDSRRQIMIKINSSLNDKIGTSFSAQDIAEDIGYSIQYLNKVSQDFRGLSLNTYLNFYKLENFRSKLLLNKSKISELAGESGFQDVNYLIQLFKKTYALTPLRLRKKLQSSTPEERQVLHNTTGFDLLKPISKPSLIKELSVNDKRCTLVIGNLSSELLELYWISPEHEEVPMSLLPGLDRVHFGSAEGHCWMLRKGNDSAYFQVGKENCLIVF